MEFITAEQFLKEDKEVQEIFRNWWFKINELKIAFKIDFEDIIFINGETKKDIYPLLTEGQLRKFIEDKIKTKLRIIPTNIGYRIIYLPGKGTDLIDKCYEGDLLQVYWKVAVQIAKESIKH